MDKNTLIEAAYGIIRESIYDFDDGKDYRTYVEGIVEMTDKLLEKLEEDEILEPTEII